MSSCGRSSDSYDIEECEGLAFDHARIITEAVLGLREDVRRDMKLAFDLLPDRFTLTELQNVYEQIWDMDQLAQSVGKVIPLASAYNVQMDNLSSAYAVLTANGIATAESGTYLKSMLNELGDTGSGVSEVLLNSTGKTFAQLMEQGYSLGDVMAMLGNAVDGDSTAFNALWISAASITISCSSSFR